MLTCLMGWVQALKTGAKSVEGGTEALSMRTRFVHGDRLISDSQTDGSFDAACKKFEAWVQVHCSISRIRCYSA